MAPTAVEVDAMRQAISLSALGLGTTSPNPPVGCVILDRRGRPAGSGYHQRKGEAHAEVNALVAAGDRAFGGTAVVTLEPCNHVGVSPACRQALLDAKISRVVIAILDPTSRGDGGAAVLADAGIDVEIGVLADEALLVLQPWLTATLERRPHVTLADPSCERLDELRQGHDVVLVDGRLEEGIVGGHAASRFSLPDIVPDLADFRPLLNAVWNSGGRTLLMIGNDAEAGALLAAGAIDRLVIDQPRGSHGHRGPRDLPARLVPGFQLTRISTIAGGIRIEARRVVGL